MSELSPLSTHLGHYKIIKLLNQGGMGQIYLAEDQRLHRTVAIKTLKTEFASENYVPHTQIGSTDANVMENALLEAQLLAKLNHANIVQIFDITQEDGQICLVMEYLSGKTLHHYQQEHISSLSQKLAIVSQISQGLTAAHKQGIVHCDLKPSNIIIDDNGGVKIVDFGIAKLTSGHGDTVNNSQSFGSQTAMSPEQLCQALPLANVNTDSIANDQSNNIDFRSDLFSLGIIAFQLISGNHPFWGGTATKTAQNILNAQGQKAQDIVPQLPRELVSLLNQLLAHQPENRPQSSQWVSAQFEQITKHLTQQEILAEDTQPISAELSVNIATVETTAELTTTDNSAKQSKSKAFILAATGLLVTLLLGIGLYSDKIFAPAALAARYIVVLPATVSQKNADNPIAAMQKDLVTATIDDAIRQNIINTKGLRLISRSEVAGISKDFTGETPALASIAAATGASDIITTNLDCNNASCNVTLSRLTVKNNISKSSTNKWTVLAQKKWPSQVENYYDIYQYTKANLGDLFSKYSDNIIEEKPIKESDYRHYVSLYNQIKIAGNSNDATLQKLHEIIISSPYLYAAYSLYSENALNLYNETNNEKYIIQIENIMASAPREYTHSVFQTLDALAIALTTRDIEKAKVLLDVAIERGIDNSTLREYHAALLLTNNEIPQAIEQYKTALTLRPSTKLLYNLSLSYYWLSDFENAKNTLNKLLDINPSKYSAKQLLAAIYLSEGELKLAISLYNDITKINPKSSDIDNLAVAYALSGAYQKAFKTAQVAVKISPNHPARLLNLADLTLILDMTEQARVLYQQVIQLSQQKDDLVTLLINAQAYVHLGHNKQAVKAINQAKKLDPDSGQVAFIAALVYSQLGEKLSAMNQVEEALSANFGVVWFNLPWFDGLCSDSDFKKMLTKAGSPKRCQL